MITKSSKTYQLNLSRKDFLTLLKMIIVADSIICGIHAEPEKEKPEYNNFYQKILQIAYDFGFTKQVEYDPKFEMYFPTKQFDDEGEPSQLIQEYDDEGFWEDFTYKYFGKMYQEKYGDAEGKMMLDMSLRDSKLFDLVWEEVMTKGLLNFENKKINKKASKLPYQPLRKTKL